MEPVRGGQRSRWFLPAESAEDAEIFLKKGVFVKEIDEISGIVVARLFGLYAEATRATKGTQGTERTKETDRSLKSLLSFSSLFPEGGSNG